MSYSHEDLCEDYQHEEKLLRSQDYELCIACKNHVHVDHLTEESICFECAVNYYCARCKRYDESIIVADNNLCETCEEMFDRLEMNRRNQLRAFYTTMTILLSAAILMLMIAMCSAAEPWREQGEAMTKEFEGYRSTPYICPAGKMTIGYGFNLESRENRLLFSEEVVAGIEPISREDADRVFSVIYDRSIIDAKAYLGDDFDDLTDVRKSIIVDMAYVLGRHRLNKFKKLRAAIAAGNYKKAASEIKDSKFYHQTGRRGKHHVKKFR